MSYEKVGWEDLPSKKTPMNAENFNHMDQGILENSLAIEETKKELDECLKSVSDGKTAVAAAITGQGVATEADASFDAMANNIASIQNVSDLPNLTQETTIDHSPDNTTPVIEGDNAYISTNSDGVQRVEIRYTGEKGIIESNTLFGVASSKFGNASATHVLSGKTFTSPAGLAVAGTMTNNGAISKTITPSTSAQTYIIPKGYHSGSGKVMVSAISGMYTVKTGSYTFPNLGATSASITFPSDFSSAPVGVYTKVSSGAETPYHYADSVTKSGFTLHAGNGDGTTTVIDWVAWGN